MNDMFNQWQTLAKLRTELEKREEKKCFGCKGFRHLVCNCRNQKEVEKGRLIPYNKFEVLKRNIRRMFKMLREMWLNIRVEKVDTHERMIVKVPLDSGITEMFMNRKMTAKHGFRLQKLV